MMITVDRHDLSLLNELQRNGEATNAALADILHLSVSQVGRRVQRLREAGIIDHYAAVLEPGGQLRLPHEALSARTVHS